jgi:hypothetical protein
MAVLEHLVTRRASPNFLVEFDCTHLWTRGGLPEKIGPYGIDAQMPADVREAFRQNPFAILPEPVWREELYKKLFAEEEADRAVQSLFASAETECQLVFESDVASFPFVCDVPWEFLTPPSGARAFGLDPRVSLVRTLPIGSERAFDVPNGLRVAHIVCNAQEVAAFDAEAQTICESLERLYARLKPAIRGCGIGNRADVPTLNEAAETLGRFSPHVLIFVGHGRTTPGGTELYFTQWESIREVVGKAVGSCPALSLVLLVACNTAHSLIGWSEKTPPRNLAVPALLEGGPSAVCAMQAAYSAIDACVFIELLLNSMFRETSLSAAFRHARFQAHLQGAFYDSSGWAVPLLFLKKSCIDKRLSLHHALAAHCLKVQRMAASFPNSPEPYIARSGVDELLERALTEKTGLWYVVAEESSGATTSLAAAALRVWQRVQAVADGASNEGLPRSFFYIDGSALPAVNRFLSAFDSATRELIATGADASALVSNEITTVEDLAHFINAARACLVVDHTWCLEPNVQSEIESFAGYFDDSVVVLVVRDPIEQTSANSLRIARFSQAECLAFATAMHQTLDMVNSWWEVSQGNVHQLRFLAMAQERLTRDSTELLRNVVALWPETADVASLCACFPTGLCRRWLASLDFRDAAVVDAGLTLGILFEETVETLPWIRVSPRFRDALFKRQEGAEGGVYAIAQKTLELMRRLLSVNDLRSVSPRTFGRSTIVRVYRRIGELKLMSGDFEGGANIVRAIYSIERPAGRHLANEESMMALLAFTPMSKWRPADLLNLAIAAQGLGHTWLHEAAIDYIDTAALEMTSLEQITFWNQRASLLKDTAKTERIDAIRTLYMNALDVAEAESHREDIDASLSRDFREQACVIRHNWGVAERYIGDGLRAKELLSDARRGYEELGDLVGATKASVEWMAAQLDLPGATPNWDRLQSDLESQLRLFEEVGAQKELAFAQYQLARLYKKRSPPALELALKMYEKVIETAAGLFDRRMEAAGRRHYASLGRKNEVLSDARYREELQRAAALLADFSDDVWAARVRRDALTAIAILDHELNAAQARESWHKAFEAAVSRPLRLSVAGSDQSRLGMLFSPMFDHFMDEATIDRATERAYPQGVSEGSNLDALRNLNKRAG